MDLKWTNSPQEGPRTSGLNANVGIHIVGILFSRNQSSKTISKKSSFLAISELSVVREIARGWV